MTNPDTSFARYIYWLTFGEFKQTKTDLQQRGKRLRPALMTPCEVLRAKDDVVLYASPSVWSRVCVRQGSWYRSSDKYGKYMLASNNKLPVQYDRYLDVQIKESNFEPASLPSIAELQTLVNDNAYQQQKPQDWENKTWLDSFMFKTLFSLTRFWGWGDNLKKYWLSHRANHANYLAKQYTAEIDGEHVPYSIADNAGICSSCVEFFNIVDHSSRKLVRACPGSVTFGGAKRKIYYDVKPVTTFNC
ncbi:hypothetical protein [Kaarinaea lacus]